MIYKIEEVKYENAEEKMNEMAKEGWKVVSTSLYVAGMALTKNGTLILITFAKEE